MSFIPGSGQQDRARQGVYCFEYAADPVLQLYCVQVEVQPRLYGYIEVILMLMAHFIGILS